VPNEAIINELKAGYKAMQEMFMKDAPDFEVIIYTLKGLEERINGIDGN